MTPEDPSPAPGALRILLSESASQHLSEHGADAFVVVGRGSHPDQPSRWRLWLVPCPVKAANAAVRVARGEARAVAIRKPITPSPPCPG